MNRRAFLSSAAAAALAPAIPAAAEMIAPAFLGFDRGSPAGDVLIFGWYRDGVLIQEGVDPLVITEDHADAEISLTFTATTA